MNLDVDCQLVPKPSINEIKNPDLYFFKEQEQGDKNRALSCLNDEKIVLNFSSENEASEFTKVKNIVDMINKLSKK